MGDYSNFVFYGNWMNTVEGYREDFGDEYADEVLLNIIYYGTTGKILSNKKSIVGFIEGSVAPNIDSAKNRYEKAQNGGARGGRQKLIGYEENVQIALLKLQGKTQKEIALIMEVSDSTIKRSEGWKDPDKFKTGQNLGQKVSSVQPVSQQEDIDKDIDKEREIDNDTGLPSLVLKKIANQYNQTIEWVKVGIGLKKLEEWQKYGYGLFSNESFQNEISIKLEEQIARQQELKRNQEIVRRQRENKIIIKAPSSPKNKDKKKKKEIDLDSLN